jgi:hypothetical protein
MESGVALALEMAKSSLAAGDRLEKVFLGVIHTGHTLPRGAKCTIRSSRTALTYS